jgi:hypothetical protein
MVQRTKQQAQPARRKRDREVMTDRCRAPAPIKIVNTREGVRDALMHGLDRYLPGFNDRRDRHHSLYPGAFRAQSSFPQCNKHLASHVAARTKNRIYFCYITIPIYSSDVYADAWMLMCLCTLLFLGACVESGTA